MAPPFRIIWTAQASLHLAELLDYLSNLMGEHSADAYVDAIVEFGNLLAEKAEHHAFCRNLKLQALGCRCAVFRKKYILIYQIEADEAQILGVLHVSRDETAFENVL